VGRFPDADNAVSQAESGVQRKRSEIGSAKMDANINRRKTAKEFLFQLFG
jgi:hypothetical protein